MLPALSMMPQSLNKTLEKDASEEGIPDNGNLLENEEEEDKMEVALHREEEDEADVDKEKAENEETKKEAPKKEEATEEKDREEDGVKRAETEAQERKKADVEKNVVSERITYSKMRGSYEPSGLRGRRDAYGGRYKEKSNSDSSERKDYYGTNRKGKQYMNNNNNKYGGRHGEGARRYSSEEEYDSKCHCNYGGRDERRYGDYERKRHRNEEDEEHGEYRRDQTDIAARSYQKKGYGDDDKSEGYGGHQIAAYGVYGKGEQPHDYSDEKRHYGLGNRNYYGRYHQLHAYGGYKAKNAFPTVVHHPANSIFVNGTKMAKTPPAPSTMAQLVNETLTKGEEAAEKGTDSGQKEDKEEWDDKLQEEEWREEKMEDEDK